MVQITTGLFWSVASFIAAITGMYLWEKLDEYPKLKHWVGIICSIAFIIIILFAIIFSVGLMAPIRTILLG